MEKLKTFLKSKQAEKFYWEFGVLALGFIATGIIETGWQIGIVVLIPIINQITKFINVNYIKK